MHPEQMVTKGMERKKETVEIWNICECGRILHSITEATRGTCAGCWIKSIKPETRSALNRLIGSAFNGSTGKQLDKAVDDAFNALAAEAAREV